MIRLMALGLAALTIAGLAVFLRWELVVGSTERGPLLFAIDRWTGRVIRCAPEAGLMTAAGTRDALTRPGEWDCTPPGPSSADVPGACPDDPAGRPAQSADEDPEAWIRSLAEPPRC